MITLKNANVSLFKHDGSICHISFEREDQDFDTLKTLGRANAVKGMIILKQSIDYKGIRFYPY